MLTLMRQSVMLKNHFDTSGLVWSNLENIKFDQHNVCPHFKFIMPAVLIRTIYTVIKTIVHYLMLEKMPFVIFHQFCHDRISMAIAK